MLEIPRNMLKISTKGGRGRGGALGRERVRGECKAKGRGDSREEEEPRSL